MLCAKYNLQSERTFETPSLYIKTTTGHPLCLKGYMALSSKIVLKESERRFTYPAFKDLSIISKSGMLSPLSFILPIIVERLILGGLWFHIKLDRDLFTWSTKPAGTLRTEEMKIIFERAKLLIMVIFPKSVKSLEDQTLRHSFKGDKLFFKVVLCWSFRITRERNA